VIVSGRRRQSRKDRALATSVTSRLATQPRVRVTLPELEALLGPSSRDRLPVWSLEWVRNRLAQRPVFTVRRERQPPAVVVSWRGPAADQDGSAAPSEKNHYPERRRGHGLDARGR
jgi:hypothetical protein